MKLLAIAAVTGLAVVLAGCGGDDDSDDGGTSSAAAPTASTAPSSAASATADPGADAVSLEGSGAFKSPVGGQFTAYTRVISKSPTARTVFVEFTVYDVGGLVIGSDNTTATVKDGDPQLLFGDFFGPEEATIGRVDAIIVRNTPPVVAVGSTEGLLGATADYVKRGLQTNITGVVTSSRSTLVTEARVTALCYDGAGKTVVAGLAFVKSVAPGDQVPYTITNPNQSDFPVTVERCEATATSTLE